MDITGKLKLIKETQVFSEKFQKREFVVETFETYPQTILIELQGKNCDIIDAYTIGQEITVDINLRGRIWLNPQGEEKYFNTIVAWKIQPSNAPVGGNTNSATTYTNPKEALTAPLGQENEPDDMPF